MPGMGMPCGEAGGRTPSRSGEYAGASPRDRSSTDFYSDKELIENEISEKKHEMNSWFKGFRRNHLGKFFCKKCNRKTEHTPGAFIYDGHKDVKGCEICKLKELIKKLEHIDPRYEQVKGTIYTREQFCDKKILRYLYGDKYV